MGGGFALLEALIVLLLLATLAGPVLDLFHSLGEATVRIREEVRELLETERELRDREAELMAPP
jgi:type II secretory pathway component PulJ